MNQIEKSKTEVAKVKSLLESPSFADQLKKALPKHLTPDRFARIAATTITRTPKLAAVDQTTLFNHLLTLSQLGLEPDGRTAHLIPFENRKRGCVEVQLIIDYKGLVELVKRSGQVLKIHADVVCKNDVFDYDLGEVKTHKPNFLEDRGEMFAAFAMVIFKDGTQQAEVMSKTEIDAIRERSRAAKSGPWVTDYNEMAKKTVFRRLSKWLPLSPEFKDAVSVDEENEMPEGFGFENAKPVTETPKASSEKAIESGSAKPTLQQLVEGAGMDLKTVIKFGTSMGDLEPNQIQNWSDVPDSVSKKYIKAKVGFINGLKKFHKTA